MLQTLEREPQEDYNHIYDASPAPGRTPFASLTVSVSIYLFNVNKFEIKRFHYLSRSIYFKQCICVNKYQSIF
jgi:hypothetical protein